MLNLLASLVILRPNRICVWTSGFLMASSSKSWRMMQLRVTLPSKGGSGSGGSGGGGGFLGAAALAAFFSLACASFCCFLVIFAGVGVGIGAGAGAEADAWAGFEAGAGAGAGAGIVVGIIGWKLAVVWIGDGCGAGDCGGCC